jgi:hypothetical protein
MGLALTAPRATPAPAVKPVPTRRRRRAQPVDASAAALRQARYAERNVIVCIEACEAELEREVAALVALANLSLIYGRIPEPRFIRRTTHATRKEPHPQDHTRRA